MDKLTPQEKINLETFSNIYAVKETYNKEGFQGPEGYIVEKYFRKKGKILDLGCGTGRTTMPFKQRGFEVTGIDLSKEMIDFARKKHEGIDFRVMDACDLDFKDASFDYIFFSFNGIDYIHPYKKRIKCINEARRVLKKGGLFVFSSHNALCVPKNRELMKVFIRNLINLKLFTKYRMEVSPSGVICTYHGIPFIEKNNLEKMGFRVLEAVGRKYNKGFSMIFFEISPYYVAKKQ